MKMIFSHIIVSVMALEGNSLQYSIVDSSQTKAFNDLIEIDPPQEGGMFYGQDTNYNGNQPSYVDNGDYTISDLVTGLMWTSGADGTGASRMTWSEGMSLVDSLNSQTYLGYSDWRVPTVKELYSLMQFNGQDASTAQSSDGLTAFVNTEYWSFEYGSFPRRLIDAQYIVSTEYAGKVMGGLPAFFGVNFADGRIKGYQSNGTIPQYFAFYVRNNTGYGENNFIASGNIVSDYATGLMWMRNDAGSGKNWQDALDYCEDLGLDGYDDWRLPNAKELHSIVDYSRSPSATDSAAIDPVFNITPITNELNEIDYPYFWSSTTHEDSSGTGGSGVYFSFGKSLGYYNGRWQDVHGAGAQKSDPKDGDPDDYPTGNGPQGDAVRILNGVRCVRNFNSTTVTNAATVMGSTSTSTPAASAPALTIEASSILTTSNTIPATGTSFSTTFSTVASSMLNNYPTPKVSTNTFLNPAVTTPHPTIENTATLIDSPTILPNIDSLVTLGDDNESISTPAVTMLSPTTTQSLALTISPTTPVPDNTISPPAATTLPSTIAETVTLVDSSKIQTTVSSSLSTQAATTTAPTLTKSTLILPAADDTPISTPYATTPVPTPKESPTPITSLTMPVPDNSISSPSATELSPTSKETATMFDSPTMSIMASSSLSTQAATSTAPTLTDSSVMPPPADDTSIPTPDVTTPAPTPKESSTPIISLTMPVPDNFISPSATLSPTIEGTATMFDSPTMLIMASSSLSTQAASTTAPTLTKSTAMPLPADDTSISTPDVTTPAPTPKDSSTSIISPTMPVLDNSFSPSATLSPTAGEITTLVYSSTVLITSSNSVSTQAATENLLFNSSVSASTAATFTSTIKEPSNSTSSPTQFPTLSVSLRGSSGGDDETIDSISKAKPRFKAGNLDLLRILFSLGLLFILLCC